MNTESLPIYCSHCINTGQLLFHISLAAGACRNRNDERVQEAKRVPVIELLFIRVNPMIMPGAAILRGAWRRDCKVVMLAGSL